MTELPLVSGRECVRALVRLGFVVKRQRGSHVVLRRDRPFAQTVVPQHTEIDRGTLRAILRQSDVSVEAFVGALR
jgi:predicted RNA binding protein YcfA (HicA-like mRNA interferase family)